MKKKIQAKIIELETKIVKADTPPLTGDIYSIGGWRAQIKILEELLA